MRLRGPIVLGASLGALVGLGFLLWPSLEDWTARQVEQRLRQETGAEWRVRGGAAISLRPSPLLVLRDLTVGNADGAADALDARIRKVTLSDPFSLIGGAASGHAVAEGLTLRAPLKGAELKPDAARSGLSLDHVASLDLVARGAKLEVSDGKSVAASAETLDLTFRTAEKPDRTAIKATVELPDHSVTLALDLPPVAAGQALAGPARLSLEPRAGGHTIAATGKAALAAGGLRLTDLAGTVDRSPFSGNAALDLAGRPRLTLDLSLDALTLTDQPPPADAKAVVVTVKPDLVPQVNWFEGYDAKANLRFGRLTLGSARLETVGVTAEVRNDGLDLALTGASAYEGGARGRYVLSPEPEGGGRHQLSLSLSKVRVLPLLSEAIGVRGIDGTGALRVDLQAKGARQEELRRTVSGSADVAVREGQLDGLDLAGAFGLLPGRNPGGLGTRLDLLMGGFTVSEGRAVTDDLQLKTAFVEASGSGSIDLFGQTLDIVFKPQLVAQGARRDERRGRLDVPVRVSGPWSHPAVSADFSNVARDPGGAIETLKDLGENILGEQGGGLGGLLDSLLPKRDDRPPGRGRSRSLGPDGDEP